MLACRGSLTRWSSVVQKLRKSHSNLYNRPRLFEYILGKRSISTLYLPPKRAGYPERFLIYHAGTARIVFIGCVKLTTIFLFSFSCLLVAPAFYYAPEEPNWAAAAAIAGGAVPMIFVAYTTAPFVNYIHVRLPVYARQSQKQLLRWSKTLPINTDIDVTTMRFSGRPRVSRMIVSDLRERKARLGVANLVRTRSSGKFKGPWWMGPELKTFYVGAERGRINEDSIWQKILERTREVKTAQEAKY